MTKTIFYLTEARNKMLLTIKYMWVSQKIVHNTYIKISKGNCENADLHSRYSNSVGPRNMHVKLMPNNILMHTII